MDDKVLKVLLTQDEYNTVITALRKERNRNSEEKKVNQLLSNALDAMERYELTRRGWEK